MKNTLFTLFLLIIATGSFAQPNTKATDVSRSDVSAIKKIIEDEHTATLQRDLTKFLNCYAKSEDVAYGFVPDIVRGYDLVATKSKAFVDAYPEPNNTPSTIADYRIRQQGNTAFVTCIATSTQPDGSQTERNKAVYLEKLNGEWKIIGHLFSELPIKKP